MNLSLEEQLLKSSLLCGLKPTGNPAYRLQLFFIANKELRSKEHQEKFQALLYKGIDKHDYWINYDKRGSGEYLFTDVGYNRAKELFGKIVPIYQPVRGEDFHILIRGEINNLLIKIETIGNHGNSTKVFINDKHIQYANAACKIIEEKTNISLPTSFNSAVRVLYNFAIDYNFDLIWKGSKS